MITAMPIKKKKKKKTSRVTTVAEISHSNDKGEKANKLECGGGGGRLGWLVNVGAFSLWGR